MITTILQVIGMVLLCHSLDLHGWNAAEFLVAIGLIMAALEMKAA